MLTEAGNTWKNKMNHYKFSFIVLDTEVKNIFCFVMFDSQKTVTFLIVIRTEVAHITDIASTRRKRYIKIIFLFSGVAASVPFTSTDVWRP